MRMPPALTITLVVLAVIALAVGLYILYQYILYHQGKRGKAKVDTLLRRYGLVRNFKVLRDVHLKLGNREARIDHMMIGFFGILFIGTVNDTAEYYGDLKSPQWTKVTSKKREKIENLAEKNLSNIDLVREIFAKNDIYKVRMDGLVVFCGSAKKSLIGVTGVPGLMHVRKLKPYINKAKFDKDNNVDVPALYQLILQYKVGA